jgi:hypothetical protein
VFLHQEPSAALLPSEPLKHARRDYLRFHRIEG